jgi:hypothetical protein
MEKSRHFIFLLLALAITSCSGHIARTGLTNSTPPKVNPGATSTPPGRLCSLFTSAEIKDLLGVAVDEGKVAGPLDSACQWDGTGVDGAFAQIQLINDTRYWEKHSGAEGYEVLKGIGKEAFVATSLGGWEAATVNDKAVVFVSLNGGATSRDLAVKFLRISLDRLGMSR